METTEYVTRKVQDNYNKLAAITPNIPKAIPVAAAAPEALAEVDEAASVDEVATTVAEVPEDVDLEVSERVDDEFPNRVEFWKETAVEDASEDVSVVFIEATAIIPLY